MPKRMTEYFVRIFLTKLTAETTVKGKKMALLAPKNGMLPKLTK